MTDFARIARRVLLIGLDAAEWNVLRPLMNAGRLPHFAALVERGLSGTMSAIMPTDRAAVWTSIATGKRAHRHGIYTTFVPSLEGVERVGPPSRAAHAIWNILAHSGLRTHCVGWPGTHPAEVVGGVCVSDAFVGACEDVSCDPAELAEQFAAFRLVPQQVQAATLTEIVGNEAMARFPAGDLRLRACAAILAEAVTTHRVVTHLLSGDDWDFMAVHYGAIGHASRVFMPFYPPATAGVSADDGRAFGGVIDSVYRFQDMLLGRALELAGDDTTVLVVSGHGFATGDQRPHVQVDDVVEIDSAWHRGGGGVCVLAGPPFKGDDLIEGVTPFDIAPTILALLGQPFGDDFDGRPLVRAIRSPIRTASIASWEAVLPLPARAAMSSDASWNEATPLIGSGYADALAEQTPEAAEAYLAILFSRAQSLLAVRRTADARPLLERLIVYRPARRQYRVELFNAAMADADYASARRVVADAVAAGHGGSLVQLGLATLALAERQPIAALAHLDRIDSSTCRVSDVLVLKGEAYLRLCRWQDAADAFHAAIMLIKDNEKAWLGLGRALRKSAEHAEAAYAIGRAIACRPDFAPAHLELAAIRLKAGDPGGARDALWRVLSLAPNDPVARRLLSRMAMPA